MNATNENGRIKVELEYAEAGALSVMVDEYAKKNPEQWAQDMAHTLHNPVVSKPADFEWISAEGEQESGREGVLEAYERLNNDERRHLPEDNPENEAWLYEAADSEVAIVREYLYLYVQPGALPDWIENMIADNDYSPEQLEGMRKELEQRAGLHSR